MLERMAHPRLDGSHARGRRAARIDASEYDEPVTADLEDGGIEVAARELDRQAADAGRQQRLEQFRIGELVLQRQAARIAEAQMNKGRHPHAFEAAVEGTRPIGEDLV